MERTQKEQVESDEASAQSASEVENEDSSEDKVEAIPESLKDAVGAKVSITEVQEMDEFSPRPPSASDPGPAPESGAAESSAPESNAAESSAPESSAAPSSIEDEGVRPSYRFFGIVAAISLVSDITTKVWAEIVINQRGFEPIKIVGDNISITLAYNQGGAWGLFSTADEMVRKPFFLGVSAFAVFFIISLYSRLHSSQKALKWGLPLVLGGALGNLSDRITRSQVIDFIDYKADWVMSMNAFIKQYVSSWTLTNHWPTFNVADIAICIGVGLMAVDMFTHRPRSSRKSEVPPEAGDSASPGALSSDATS